MKSCGHIDRRKSEGDITERVLEGGVWTGPTPIHRIRVVGIDLGAQPWPLGAVASPVQVRTFGDDPDEH
jgi:hypothetical protein